MSRELFRTDPAYGLELLAESVDMKTRTIGGAAVMQLGEVKDGRFEIDRQTLDEIVQLGNQPKMGVKVRFGHSSMSDDALGSFLGRAKNFRIDPDGELARADIHFDASAFDTPSGDLAGYVLSLGGTDPESFGMSVAVEALHEQRLNADGTPQKHDETGEVLSPLLRVQSLLAVDFVDSPAATNALFGMNGQTMLSAEAMVKLEELIERPEFITRAHVFFERAFTQIEKTSTKKEHSMPEEKPRLTVAELSEMYATQVGVIQSAAKQEALADERQRVTKIVEFAQTMKCDVSKELLAAVSTGQTVDGAGNEFLRVELAVRTTEANQPTGMKGDSMPEEESFASYEEAWASIKRLETCSTADAMRKAQDRYPKLYEQFFASCKRGRV